MESESADRSGRGSPTCARIGHKRSWRARSCVAAAEAFAGAVVGERTSLDGTRVPWLRLAPGVADRTTTGAIEAMSLWAGESVGAVRRVQPAAEIVRELAEEAEALLRRWT